MRRLAAPCKIERCPEPGLEEGSKMRIAVGSDHRGVKMRGQLVQLLKRLGQEVVDVGSHEPQDVDYPDVAAQVAHQVSTGQVDRGVLICGTGLGMCIAANKVKGIRAAQCHSVFTAHRARQHNDAHICCLAAEEGKARVPAIVEAFLTTEFEGGRHVARLDKMRTIEDR